MRSVTANRRGRSTIPTATRVDWRRVYGDLPSMIDAAERELAAGSIVNAVAAYQSALAVWLKARWVEHCGKPGTGIGSPNELVAKLVSARVIDRWLHDAILAAMAKPQRPDRRHIDTLAAIVAAVTLCRCGSTVDTSHGVSS